MAGEGTSRWQRLQLCLEGQTKPLRAGHRIRKKKKKKKKTAPSIFRGQHSRKCLGSGGR